MPNTPPGIIDMWDTIKVGDLTIKHTVAIMGTELRVTDIGPSARGGDFYTLAAISPMRRPDGVVTGVVTLDVDRNQKVYARLTDEG